MMILMDNVLIGNINICNSLLLSILWILYSPILCYNIQIFTLAMILKAQIPTVWKATVELSLAQPARIHELWTRNNYGPASQPAIPASDNATPEWGLYRHKSEQTKLIVTRTTKEFAYKFNWGLHVTAQIDEVQMICESHTTSNPGSQWYTKGEVVTGEVS